MATLTQAVLLARGLGTRLQRKEVGTSLSPEAEAMAGKGLKTLMPINGHPLIDYILSRLHEVGFRRIILVVAPDASELKTRVTAVASRLAGLEARFAVQEKALGTADAVLASEGTTDGEPFAVLNGDNLYSAHSLQQLVTTNAETAVAVFERDALAASGNIRRERINKFGIVVPTAEWLLDRIVEKPSQPEKYLFEGKLWLNMNLFRFTRDVYTACRSIPADPERGEYEITTALQYLKDGLGLPVRVLGCEGPVLDLTSRSDVPTLERMLEGFKFGF